MTLEGLPGYAELVEDANECGVSKEDVDALIKERLEFEFRIRIRNRLEEISEFIYNNGCIMFNTDICTPEEALRLADGKGNGMLDALARTLAEAIL